MSDPKQELKSLALAYVMKTYPLYTDADAAAEQLAEDILALGWLSPVEHTTYRDLATLAAANDIQRAKRAEAKVERVAALADALEHWFGDDSIDDVIAAVRGAIAEFDGTQTSGHTSPAAGDTPEAAARKGSQPAVSGTHLGT